MPDSGQKLRRFCLHFCDKCLVLHRVIKVGKHEILPYHNAQFIAKAIKIRCLIGGDTAQAQHVHASFLRELQPWLVIVACTGKADDIRRTPYRPATEYLFAIDPECKAFAIRPTIYLDAAKAGAPQRSDFSVERKFNIVKRRIAVRMWPPRLDMGKCESCRPLIVGLAFADDLLPRTMEGERCGLAAISKTDLKFAIAGFGQRCLNGDVGYGFSIGTAD